MSVDVVDRHRVLERDAGTSHAACMRLYTSTSTLARNADDLFMIYVLETCIKPTIGPEREWRTRFNGGHIGTAVQELIRCSMYLHLRKDLEASSVVRAPRRVRKD
ncbi:hypothetical protein BMF94_6033 [Rhodotorula taiwanensis]|uniref:Uncharacterized protein n=1 Tax=Rhodotorula taiwanensis TaxID=741276 RepID=A0A2S5B2G5_9BASI|nr:hypothetical protein BMF94_6033 [Rhodotorula taiwanensis]